jgi:tRNA (cytidine/uridine-2'-O-)-methyltransferase
MTVERHIVLVAPEVHWNTGNIGRTCLGTGAQLHLIEPLGFSLDDKHVKRAGLDYWQKVKLSVWKNFNAFVDAMSPKHEEIVLLAKRGGKNFWEMPRLNRLFLVFGSETKGLPECILSAYDSYHIPITSEIRSLNLSTAAGISLYESLRDTRPSHGWKP